MSTPPLNPPSFRFPFEAQIAKLPPDHQKVVRTQWNAITDLQQAIPLIKSQLDSLKTTTTTTTAAAVAASNVTENTTTINETILGFSVSNQTGVTAYTVQQSDNTAMLLLSDASPIAVTLDTTLTIPYGLIPVNQGAGLVTLTPNSGTINGVASIDLPEGYFAILASDGTNWWGAVLPLVGSAQTTVSGSISGAAVFSQPFQFANYKKVIIYLNALDGTASYTFPISFSIIPDYFIGASASSATVTAISTTAVTVSGVGGSGIIILEGY